MVNTRFALERRRRITSSASPLRAACRAGAFASAACHFAQHVGGECGDLDVTEFRQDQGLRAISRVLRRLAIMFEELEIGLDRSLDGERTGCAGVGPPHHACARLVLGLPEIENGDTVRVAEVIGDAKLLDRVCLLADVVASDPSAGAASTARHGVHRGSGPTFVQ
jgi:hypothetical protein